MRTLWLQFGNTAAGRRRFAVPALDYPLSFNLPPVSWSLEPGSLEVSTETSGAEFHLDLVMELSKDVTPNGPVPDAGWIAGYRLCLGVFDKSFQKWSPSPSTRDKGVFDYYARWHERCNAVGPLWRFDPAAEPKTSVSMEWEGVRHEAVVESDLGPLPLLSFFHPFNHLAAGDLISLGTFLTVEAPLSPVGMRIGLGEQQWPLPVNRG